jgi:hypothetical protein
LPELIDEHAERREQCSFEPSYGVASSSRVHSDHGQCESAHRSLHAQPVHQRCVGFVLTAAELRKHSLGPVLIQESAGDGIPNHIRFEYSGKDIGDE